MSLAPPGEALRGRSYGRFRLDAPGAGIRRADLGSLAYALLTAGSMGPAPATHVNATVTPRRRVVVGGREPRGGMILFCELTGWERGDWCDSLEGDMPGRSPMARALR